MISHVTTARPHSCCLSLPQQRSDVTKKRQSGLQYITVTSRWHPESDKDCGRMHIPLAFHLFLLMASLCVVNSKFCVRHVKYHYVSRDDYDLGYLNRLHNITEALLQEGSISKTSADIMKRTLSFSAHTLCEPGHAESREKRQVVSGLIGLLSGLVVPHIFHALIYPSGTASEISRFRSFAMKTRGMARQNAHKIYDLEQRINRIQRREDVNAIFDNIMQNLQLEEMKFSELINNGPKFSTTLYNMLKLGVEQIFAFWAK